MDISNLILITSNSIKTRDKRLKELKNESEALEKSQEKELALISDLQKLMVKYSLKNNLEEKKDNKSDIDEILEIMALSTYNTFDSYSKIGEYINNTISMGQSVGLRYLHKIKQIGADQHRFDIHARQIFINTAICARNLEAIKKLSEYGPDPHISVVKPILIIELQKTDDIQQMSILYDIMIHLAQKKVYKFDADILRLVLDEPTRKAILKIQDD
jgi:hypothetical protein